MEYFYTILFLTIGIFLEIAFIKIAIILDQKYFDAIEKKISEKSQARRQKNIEKWNKLKEMYNEYKESRK